MYQFNGTSTLVQQRWWHQNTNLISISIKLFLDGLTALVILGHLPQWHRLFVTVLEPVKHP